MVFAGGNAQEPMAVAEVLVGETALFRAEKKGDTAGSEAFADEGSGLRQAFHGMQWASTAERRGADYESAVSDGFGNGFEFFSAGKKGRGADGGRD